MAKLLGWKNTLKELSDHSSPSVEDQYSPIEPAASRTGPIFTVNGKDVKTISMDEQQTFFKNLKSLTLEIERDGAKSTVSFSFDDPKI